jgi:hypothetical protein
LVGKSELTTTTYLNFQLRYLDKVDAVSFYNKIAFPKGKEEAKVESFLKLSQ